MLTPAELRLLADELEARLAGARLQKVHGPAPDRFTIQLHLPGEDNRLLLVVLDERFPRLHLAEQRPKNPRHPPPFVETLRRELSGARVVGCDAIPGERIVRLRLQIKRDETVQDRWLVIELIPRRHNLFLLGALFEILHLLHPGRDELARGKTWAPPPGGAPDSSDVVPFAAFGPKKSGEDLSQLLERSVTPQEQDSLLDEGRRRIGSELKKRLKKERRLLKNLEADLAAAEKAPELRERAELLQGHLHELGQRVPEAEVLDYRRDPPETVTLTLDPLVTPRENMERWFKEARKLERSLGKVAGRHDAVAERCAALQELVDGLEAAEEPDAVAAVEARAQERGLLPRPQKDAGGADRKAQARRLPYRSYTSIDGLEILVGRTAADNDELTFKVAKGNDVWLHVAGSPGSHVVIRASGGEVPHETLLDAATLALYYSKIPKGGSADVSWTHRKHVSKFKGARSGQVQLAKRRTLRVRPDPRRLDRLQGKEEGGR